MIKKLLVLVSFFIGIFSVYSESAPIITYQETCQRAVKRATALKLASKGVVGARIMTKNAYTKLLPVINSSFRYTRNNYEVTFEFEGEETLIQPITSKIVNASVEMPILHVRVPLLIQSANFNLLAEQEKLRKTLGDVLYNASELYLMILAAEDSIKILQESVKNLQQHRDISLARYDVGDVPETEYLQAEYRLATSELNLLEAQTVHENLKENLRILIHWEGDFQVVNPDFLDDTEFFRTPDFDKSVEDAIKYRPDLKEAKANFKTVKALKNSVAAEFAPTMSGFFNWEYDPDATIFLPEEHTWMVGVSVNWSIFEGGSRFVRMQQYNNEIEITRLNYENILEEVKRSIYKILNEISTTRKRLEVNKKQNTVASKNYELFKEMFDVGLATSKDVLDANTSLISTELSETIDRYNMARQYLNLLNETGQLLSYLSIGNDTLIELTGGKEKAWRKWPRK